MRAEHPLTKQDERRLLADMDRERHELERDLPQDRQHADPEWVKAFWQARRMLS
jgi:hypothetical protein